MAVRTAVTHLSTGIESLDHLLEGLLWGECVVFHANETSEFVSFLQPLFSFLSAQRIPISWITFSNKSPSAQLQNFPTSQVHLILPTNLEQFMEQISMALHTAVPTFFIFEELTELRRMPNGEAEIVPAVERITEQLSNGNGSAYLQMRKGVLSDSTVAQIKDRVTVFMDLWKVDDALFFQPIKVLGRYSKKLFKSYQYSDGVIRPTEGIEFEEYARALENKSREFLELYSQKRHIETDLQRKVFELSLINGITTSLLSTMNLDEILYRILVGVTAKEGLGFNRAFLLLVNEEENVLEGKIAIGPSSLEEAMQIWMALNNRH